MAGLAAGSTQSRMTQLGQLPRCSAAFSLTREITDNIELGLGRTRRDPSIRRFYSATCLFSGVDDDPIYPSAMSGSGTFERADRMSDVRFRGEGETYARRGYFAF